MNYIWSEDKFQLHVHTTQVILALKRNTDLSCEAFREKIASNAGVLKQIQYSNKCLVIARTSNSKELRYCKK
jgi:hypothetical protein